MSHCEPTQFTQCSTANLIAILNSVLDNNAEKRLILMAPKQQFQTVFQQENMFDGEWVISSRVWIFVSVQTINIALSQNKK